MDGQEPNKKGETADLQLDRDNFMRTLIRELAGTLEDVVGLEDAIGYISVVGTTIAGQIDTRYRRALKVDKLSRAQVGEVLVDLKRRIEGQFYIIEENNERIVLGNKACPFGDKVLQRPSMCMMTSNVFGGIAAENLGYARVELQKTIAQGDAECLVVVHLQPPDNPATMDGREYFSIAD